MKRILVSLVVSLLLCTGVLGAQALDFDSPRWQINGPKTGLTTHLGRRALHLGPGEAMLRDVSFQDGTIEVDVAVTGGRSFVGFVFHAGSDDGQETFYLRPHKSNLPDALQYAPVFNKSSAWQLFSGPGFTAEVEIPRNEWIHVRIEVAGKQARIYLNRAATPALEVKELKRGIERGAIGVYGAITGGYFSGFSVRHAERAIPNEAVTSPKLDPRILSRWAISEAFDASELGSETQARPEKWQPVTTEAPGMVMIDRYRGNPSAGPRTPVAGPVKGRKVVFARAMIVSDRDQVKKMNFGYSDEVTVYLNGKKLFTGRSNFLLRDETFLGIMNVEGDALYLPLQKGRNELLLAVGEVFGGWGYICRLADLEGIDLSR